MVICVRGTIPTKALATIEQDSSSAEASDMPTSEVLQPSANGGSTSVNGYINHPSPLRSQLSPSDEQTTLNSTSRPSNKMTGQKMFTEETPKDHARRIAAGLSLEEQVCWLHPLQGRMLKFQDIVAGSCRLLEDNAHTSKGNSIHQDFGWPQRS